jgi:phosphoserine phosphatase
VTEHMNGNGNSMAEGTPRRPSIRKDDAVRGLSSLLRYFDVAQPETIRQKLVALCTDPGAIELWADFDNTLSKKTGGVWEALRSALPAAGKAESDAERRANLAKEKAGTLTPEEHIAWSQRELGRYVRYGVTEGDIARAVEAMSLRRGARDLFKFCAGAGIDRYIVSTSIADAIELVVGLHASHVRSNRLSIKDGVVIGWDETSMLHSGNKHVHAANILAGRPRNSNGWKIVLGDNRHDADMIPGDKALRIRTRDVHGNTAAYLKESFAPSSLSPGFDLVLRTQTLAPVVRLLQWAVDKRLRGCPEESSTKG